ncbi:LysM peptidoglycan-binding domain-containing protein [Paenibacillus mendelii]|uniref:LysM peptidoglycan-binding domain-containing protein n=1 Tax=Paenibacillus mendelii TaxID=206163 RepID=A0ABV6J210_9BACL|nr:LysM peptidoglycan-binding domain-containing protein [Paenibacillus mendelii]MCQ6562837.1 LysM peptidoglycan-binding domain-containing protein [Paenibacillus mendelii]
MNKDSTRSAYSPRSSRTRKNKPVYKIILASATFLLVICGALYSIYGSQFLTGHKPSAADNKNISSDNEPVETDDALDDELTGNEQAGSSDASVHTPLPDEPSIDDQTESEILPEEVPVADADQDDGQEVTLEPDKGNDGNKAPAVSNEKVKLPTTYVVRKGDTLSTISMKFYHSKNYVALLADHNEIVFINDMNVGDTIKIPALSSKAGSVPKKQPDNKDNSKVDLPVTYMIRSGDTLYRIAMEFYRSADYVDLIAEHNKLDKNKDLKAGNNLIIPAIPVNQAENNNSTNKGVTSHTVQKGETLSSISRKYFGVSDYAKSIAEYNQDNDHVKVGDVLKIPPASAP